MHQNLGGWCQAEDEAQPVECLPSVYKALDVIPSPT